MSTSRWIAFTALLLVAIVVGLDLGRQSPGDLAAVHARVTALAGSGGCVECHGDERRSMAAACNECHDEIAAQLTAGRGLHGQLAPDLASDCARCHLEHHGTGFRMVGARSFELAGVGDVEAYAHQGLDYGLAGRHAALDCQACHEHARCQVLPEGAARFLGLRQDCVSCHEDPHDGALPDCASCHGEERPFGEVAEFEHDERFALTGGHAGLACRECHAAATARSVEALAAPRAGAAAAVRACGDCHTSAHAVTFLAGAARELGVPWSRSCTACHDAHDASFAAPAAKMTVSLHAATGFALDAPHAGLECRACHDPDGASFAARYPRRDPQRCEACHDDPHRDQFAQSPFAAAGCLGCHAPLRFAPPTFEVADHQRTAFPLTGAHRAVGCDRCHQVDADLGARLFHGTSRDCAQCHDDVHDGAFDRPGLPAVVAGREGCARCHGTESFAQVDAKLFDHAVWTGYALRGAHRGAKCADCHGRDMGLAARSLGRAPADCAACHSDPHAGQFRVRGSTDCARCHDDAHAWRETRFDHDRHSRFPLDEKHRALACAACHRSYATKAGGDVVRYRPLGTACADCHGASITDPSSPLKRGR